MSSEDEITEVLSLLNELDIIFRKWEAKELDSYVMDQDREIMQSGDNISLSFDKFEIIKILQGLLLLSQSYEAEKFIKDSLGNKMTSEQRWSKVAEIMLLKNPGEKLRPHGVDEIIRYRVLIGVGKTPKDAAKEIYKVFPSFNSQSACNKWICDEINRYKKSGNRIFGNLPKPHKYDE